jgi:hypothetical protein
MRMAAPRMMRHVAIFVAATRKRVEGEHMAMHDPVVAAPRPGADCAVIAHPDGSGNEATDLNYFDTRACVQAHGRHGIEDHAKTCNFCSAGPLRQRRRHWSEAHLAEQVLRDWEAGDGTRRMATVTLSCLAQEVASGHRIPVQCPRGL